MQNNSYQDKTERVISLLDGIHRAEPQPFFYTRLRARLDKNHVTIWDRVSTLLTKPVIAFTGVLMVLMLNLFAIISHTSSSSTNDQTEITSTDEYAAVSNSYYDIENKP